jgi:hypothetical protein
VGESNIQEREQNSERERERERERDNSIVLAGQTLKVTMEEKVALILT